MSRFDSETTEILNTSSPWEIQAQNQRGADIARLLRVAAMSDRNKLRSLKRWALDVVFAHCQPEMGYLDVFPPDMLRQIFQVATANGRDDVCRLITREVKDRLAWMLVDR